MSYWYKGCWLLILENLHIDYLEIFFGLWKYNLNNGDFFLGKGEWISLLGFNFSSDHNYKLYLIFLSQPKHIAFQ